MRSRIEGKKEKRKARKKRNSILEKSTVACMSPGIKWDLFRYQRKEEVEGNEKFEEKSASANLTGNSIESPARDNFVTVTRHGSSNKLCHTD